MTPTSQKDRPISFLLFDGNNVVAWQDLIIRPEELTRQEPSRNKLQQTLGGAWLDSFGPGVASITLSGHTGWRGNATEDGEAIFFWLRDTVFVRWHELRAEKGRQLKDLDDVKLVLADQLDGFAVVVSPQQFQLRRHKSRPLLIQFQISLAELGDFSEAQQAFSEQDTIVEAIDNPRREQLAHESLQTNIDRRTTLIDELKASGLSTGLISSGVAMLELSNALLEKVNGIADETVGVFDATTAPLLSLSTSVLQASANAFAILAMPSDIAAHAKITLMAIASNAMDAYCNLRNSYNRLFQYPDFSNLFGASTCSSTGGGRPHSPWAQENPFLQVFPTKDPLASVSREAQIAMASISGTDGISGDVQQGPLLSQMRSVTSGVALA